MKQTPTNTENDFEKYCTTKQMKCKTKSSIDCRENHGICY